MKHLIVGPCSVESAGQLRQVVRELLPWAAEAEGRELYFRGGVWKPRSRPGGFEGLGEAALGWMRALKEEFPLARFCTEVATPEHVELCMKYGIDGVWIGSRTAGNPFSVNEICQALEGTAMRVWVKNPLTPDLRLWLGAVERVQKAVRGPVGAVHRGFTPYHDSPFRNEPMWEIPIELRRHLPQTALICDPSHIAGRRELLPSLAQTALDLRFDGLMVEVHPRPEEALTDARQQITPRELRALLRQTRQPQEGNPPELALLRQQMDRIDHQLIDLLAERIDISRQIARVKTDHHMAVLQPKRWEEVLEQIQTKAAQKGLDPSFTQELYNRIHTESVRVQLERNTPGEGQEGGKYLR